MLSSAAGGDPTDVPAHPPTVPEDHRRPWPSAYAAVRAARDSALDCSVGPRPRDRPTESTPTPTPPAGSVSLTAAEEARAAELEAQIVATERAAETNATRARERARRPAEGEVRVRSGSIAERASHEYAYVARDVRRIITIGGSLIGFLLALWVVLQATGIGRI